MSGKVTTSPELDKDIVGNYHKNFIDVIKQFSESDSYPQAIKEWRFYGESDKTEEESRCICGHVIWELCYIHNIINKNVLIVGNCCVKRIGVERRHYNKSKMAYVELGIMKAESKGVKDYLIYETLEKRVKRGKRFTKRDIRVLEKVTGRKCRFNQESKKEVIV